MEIVKDGGELRSNLNGASTNLNDTIEVELYDELVAFSEMSPEQQIIEAEQAAKNEVIKQPDELSSPAIRAFADADFVTDQTPGAIKPGEVKLSSPTVIAEDETIDYFDELVFETTKSETNDEPPALAEESATESQPNFKPLSNTSPLEDIWSGARVKTGPLAMCQSCGNRADVEDLFCIACGEFLERADLGPDIATNCLACDALIGNDDMFCASCGSMVTT